jgi:hypothetical protein
MYVCNEVVYTVRSSITKHTSEIPEYLKLPFLESIFFGLVNTTECFAALPGLNCTFPCSMALLSYGAISFKIFVPEEPLMGSAHK